jgi:formate dehydrogenase major subunit
MKDKKSNCLFCSLGCGLVIRVDGDRPVELDYDVKSSINHGSLCPRGNYMLELLNSPARLNTPKLRENRVLMDVDASKALEVISERLKSVEKKHGPEAIGVMLGPNCFNEEISSIYNAFKRSLGVINVDVSFPLEDIGSLAGEDAKVPFNFKGSSVEEIDDQDALLIIGDVLVRTPVLSKRINNVKYKNRGSRIIVVDPERSHTSWFATTHLQVKPGTEVHLIAGMIKVVLEAGGVKASRFKKYFEKIDLKSVAEKTGVPSDLIIRAAKEFSGAKKGSVLAVSSFRDKLLIELSKLLAFVSAGKKGVLPLYSSGNTIGSFVMINSLRSRSSLSCSDMIDAAARGRLKALVLLGVDPVRSVPGQRITQALSNLDLLVVADYYMTAAMDYADVILPLSSHLEGAGSVHFSGGRSQELDSVVPKVGSMSVHDIALGVDGGLDLKKVSAEVKKAARGHKPKGKFLLTKIYDDLKSIKLPREDKNLPYLLNLRDDIVHSADGSVTSKHYWAVRECQSPCVEINEDDAAELGISDGDRVLLKTKESEVVLNAGVSSKYQRGILAVPHHFQEIRELVGLKLNEELRSFEVPQVRAAVERIG